MSIIYQNNTIKIESEKSEIPWLKIFTQEPYKEMSEVPTQIRFEIYDLLKLILSSAGSFSVKSLND